MHVVFDINCANDIPLQGAESKCTVSDLIEICFGCITYLALRVASTGCKVSEWIILLHRVRRSRSIHLYQKLSLFIIQLMLIIVCIGLVFRSVCHWIFLVFQTANKSKIILQSIFWIILEWNLIFLMKI